MAISDLFVLLLGSLFLSAVAGYVSWTILRVWRLQCNLLDIRVRLQGDTAAIGCLRDAEYCHWCQLIDRWIQSLNTLSGATLMHRVAADLSGTGGHRTANEPLRQLLDKAMDDVVTCWERSGMAWVARPMRQDPSSESSLPEEADARANGEPGKSQRAKPLVREFARATLISPSTKGLTSSMIEAMQAEFDSFTMQLRHVS